MRTTNVVALVLSLLFFGGCQTGGAPAITTQEVLQHALQIVEVVGDATVQVKGYALLQKYAPAAIPIIDVNNDKIITLAEVKAAGSLLLAQPELVAGLLAAAYMLRKG